MDDKERREFKEKVRNTFNAVCQGYDKPALRFFPDSASHLPKHLELKGDEHVLDVASGTGTSAIALAQGLPKGKVTGIDFSAGMLGRAREKISAIGINNVELIEMDMNEIAFPDGHFDAAASAFGVFFAPDMVGLVRHISEKIKPGGRFVMSTFDEASFSPLSGLFFDRLEKFGVKPPLEARRRLCTKAECSDLLKAAGLNKVAVHKESMGYYLKDAGQWMDIVGNTAYSRFFLGFDDKVRAGFIAEHEDEISALATAEGIWLNMEVLYSVGEVVKGQAGGSRPH